MSPQAQRSPSVVPLARDQDGNPIELPDGAIGWRIRRQTGGRPRLLLDAKKQPMVFPLDYTIADVEDILSPGNYLLDVVDKSGEPLGVTIGFTLGMPRNAEPTEPDNDNDVPAMVPATLPNTTSDVRLVLEANVRATQMAFVHNQRTLEIGLRMAETLRDSVQVLANAQADWIKSVSSARGFFRNAAPPLPPVEVKQLTVQTGGEDDDDDDDDDDRDHMASSAAAPQHWSAPFASILHSVVEQAGPAIMAWAIKQPPGGAGGHGASRNGTGNDDRAPRWEARDRGDWRYANQKQAAHRERKAAETQAAEEQARQAAKEAHDAKLTAAIDAASSPGPKVDVMKLVQMLPQRTVAKFMQLQAALSPDEQAGAMQIIGSHDAEGLEDLLRTLDAASLEEATDFVRRLIADLRAGSATKRAKPAAPPPSSGGSGSSAGSSASGTGSGSAEP